jgi:hypothetical protein
MTKLHLAWLTCLSSLLLFSCNVKTDSKSTLEKKMISRYDSILDYFATRQNRPLKSKFNALYVITEMGCVTCNKQFYDLIKSKLKDPQALFLVQANGAYLNLSGLDSLSNVYFDQSLLETDYKIFHQSKVIYFKDAKIDTVVTINDARLLEAQLDFIKR